MITYVCVCLCIDKMDVTGIAKVVAFSRITSSQRNRNLGGEEDDCT